MKRELIKKKVTADYEGYISLYRVFDGGLNFVTWRSNKDTPEETYWGHYFASIVDATKDYTERN